MLALANRNASDEAQLDLAIADGTRVVRHLDHRAILPPTPDRHVGAAGGGAYRRGMGQRISIVTLGVADIGRSRNFYEELGWRGQEVEETVFFQAGGQAVVLWGRDKLAADAGVSDDGATFGGIVRAHNVGSPGEVDQVVDRAASAGAAITRRPGDTFYGGYAGYFCDPDGHVWEVAFNPGFAIDGQGNLTVPPLDGAS